MISKAQSAAQKRFYAKNRKAVILQTKMRASGVRLTLAECRRIVASTSQEAPQ